jgi:pyrroloquinoline quinone biosynthesis protein B
MATYCSAAAAVTPDVRRALDGVDVMFFDGTFWSSDELPALGLGTKRAEEMAHLPVGGPGGSLARLADVRAGRRVYIHINNTNPMLREDSAERREVDAAGWEIAADGMEVRL